MKKENSYENYKAVRNKVWEFMLKHNVSKLPVKIIPLLRKMDVRVFRYCDSMELIEKLGVTDYTVDNDGFAVYLLGKYYVFYDETVKSNERIRFTLAHELGHIVLGHLLFDNEACRNGVSVWNREAKSEFSPNETEANIFASRLLAPACVLRELNVSSAKEISKLCEISKTAAKIRAKRMKELRLREKQWYKQHGRSCFYLSPTEKCVISQFENYIKNKKE